MKVLKIILKIFLITIYSCVWICLGFLFLPAPWKLFRKRTEPDGTTIEYLDHIDEDIFDGK